jgi:GTP-binding protein Era
VSDNDGARAGHRSGFVALVGRPSAGKSTLLNRLLGQKVAIVSPKPQTTRGRILGVASGESYQLALVDTPGLHPRERGLSAALNQVAEQAARDVDLVALVVDAHARDRNADQELLDRVRRARSERPLALVLNKVDLIEKPALLPMIQRWSALQHFELVYPLSALRGENVEGLLPALAELLPEGPPLYPADVFTDQSERALCAELIREQIYRLTQSEIPYSVAVEVEEFDESKREGPRPKVHIAAVIFVARESQKGILIGKRAAKLKAIGTAARKEIEKLLGAQVYLALTVRLEAEWTESAAALRRFGYGPQGGT